MGNSITYVGLDVHKNTYSACCYNLEDGQAKFKSTFNATIKNLLKYLESIKGSYPVGTKFICGYKAGFLGYSLYRELENYAVECWVLAPATIKNLKNKRIKNDKRDAENIAKSMAFNTASKVYVLDEKIERFDKKIEDMSRRVYVVKYRIIYLTNLTFHSIIVLNCIVCKNSCRFIYNAKKYSIYT